ncbi:MAG: alcohol dehydrogenase catalytic domain-containing protein [Kiritimatiellia bacterium]
MKTVKLTGIRETEMFEVDTPRIENDTDVLLKVEMAGVCGSDVHYYTTGRIGSQVVQYPFTVGHECSATVEETGAGVTGVKAGDRVAVDPAMSCGHCDQCLAGRAHTCRNLRFLGCPGQSEGCLSEYIVMPEKSCYPIPESTTLEQGALVEPLSIGVYGFRQAELEGKARIGILGCGPIGLSVIAAASSAGVESIYATDRIDARLKAARELGAVWTGNADEADVVKEIGEKEPLLLDAVFECCGRQEALDQAVSLLKPGGKLMLIGIPEVDRVSFVIDNFRRREICLQNVRRQNECVQPAINLLDEGKTDLDFLITHRFSLEQTGQAFDLVADYGDGVIKAMIRVDPE